MPRPSSLHLSIPQPRIEIRDVIHQRRNPARYVHACLIGYGGMIIEVLCGRIKEGSVVKGEVMSPSYPLCPWCRAAWGRRGR